MEEESVVDISQACRLCLMNENDPNMLCVDEETLKTMHICAIKIYEIQNCPARICQNCHSILLFILKFHKMCENSLIYLRETMQDESVEIVPKQDPDEYMVDKLENEDEYCAEVITSDGIQEEVITEITETHSPEAQIEEIEHLHSDDDNDGNVGNEEYVYDTQTDVKVRIDHVEYEQLETLHENEEEEILVEEVHKREQEEEGDDLTVYILDDNSSQPRDQGKMKEGQTLLRSKNTQLSLKHQVSSKVFACEICGNTYRKMGALESHRRRHRNARPYECEICSESFDYNFKLERHMRKHTGVKPFICEFCDRRFVDRSTMSRHQKIHRNERAYPCTICGKSFTYYSVLKTHIMSHTGEKPFSCGICDKGFHRASDLKNHLETLQHSKDPRVPELLKNIRRKDEITLHGFV